MQLADSPEMCSLNHLNPGHFMKVLGKAQLSGIQCLDQHTSAGPGHSLGLPGHPGMETLHELHEGEAADGAVPRDQIRNVWNDSGAPCILPGKSTCMHKAQLGCGSDSSGTGLRTHLQCQPGRSTPGFGYWETQSHEDENRAFQGGNKS